MTIDAPAAPERKMVRLPSLEAFEEYDLLEEDVHYAFPLGRATLDIRVVPKKKTPMVVFFSAAVSAKVEKKLPWFAGSALLSSVDVTKVFISDPTLYLAKDINLAWYIGAQDIEAQPAIVRSLKSIIAKTEPSKVLFVGGSGGGFASLYYSAQIPESMAVAWNPQTDIFCYTPRSVIRYLSGAWGIQDIEEGRKALNGKVTTDLYSEYSPEKSKNYVLYLQNKKDTHVQVHLTPFLRNYGVGTPEKSGMIGDKLYLELADFGEGHAAPHRTYLKRLVRFLLQDLRGWPGIFGQNGIPAILQQVTLSPLVAAEDSERS